MESSLQYILKEIILERSQTILTSKTFLVFSYFWSEFLFKIWDDSKYLLNCEINVFVKVFIIHATLDFWCICICLLEEKDLSSCLACSRRSWIIFFRCCFKYYFGSKRWNILLGRKNLSSSCVGNLILLNRAITPAAFTVKHIIYTTLDLWGNSRSVNSSFDGALGRI